MKPSEFITKFKVYKEQNNIILKPVTFEDLDLKFIDREELKEKILKRIKETDKSSEYGWSCISKDDILELLK